MSKTTIALLLALVAGAAAFYFLRERETVEPADAYPERRFAVDDRDDVHRIFAADMTGRSMDFRRRPDGTWTINDTLPASPSVIAQMVATLEQLRIDHVPTRATAEVQRQNLASNGLKVEAYDAEGRKLTGVLIGASVRKGAGSYMVVDGYDEVFAVRRGMLTGTVRPQFDLRSVAAYRAFDFMKYDPADIRSVEVRYPRLPSRSFRVDRAAGALAVEPLADVAVQPSGPVQARRIEGYLEGFANVPVARWTNDHPYRDSISAMTPFAQIIVATSEVRDTYELQPAALLNEYGVPDQSQPFNTFWVERGRTDFVTVQDHQIDQLLRDYQSFFESGEAVQ